MHRYPLLVKKRSKWNWKLADYHLDLAQQNKAQGWLCMWFVPQWRTTMK